MSKYKFTYFLNTACAERRPQTRRDLIEDWKEEEKEFPLDIEAFEYAYTDICEYGDEEDLADIYEDLNDKNDDLEKIDALKEEFENVDIGDGSTILISIEGPGQKYDSGYTKEDFNDDYIEDDEDYDDDEELDENKKLNEAKSYTINEIKVAYENALKEKDPNFDLCIRLYDGQPGIGETCVEADFKTIEDFEEYAKNHNISNYHVRFEEGSFDEDGNFEYEGDTIDDLLLESIDNQLEIDEKGLPVLERPYNISKRNDNRLQITSSHPYDLTEYSYAISENDNIDGDWNVYDPGNPRTIISDYSARKTTLEGTYKGWNEAFEVMKKIDSKKTRNIDKT